jgi:hypothetical protein
MDYGHVKGWSINQPSTIQIECNLIDTNTNPCHFKVVFKDAINGTSSSINI